MVQRQIKVWSIEEDYVLEKLVETYGSSSWKWVESLLALACPGSSKSALECRSRWKTRLAPGLKIGRWSFDERQRAYALHQQLGNQWAQIARLMGNRSDVAVKNFFYYVIKQAVVRQSNESLDQASIKQKVLQLVKDKACTVDLGLAHPRDPEELMLASIYQEWSYWAELLASLTQSHPPNQEPH